MGRDRRTSPPRPTQARRGIRLWHAEGPQPGVRERILPTGRAQLIFDLGGASATLIGPSFMAKDIDRVQSGRLIGVVFGPGVHTSYLPLTTADLLDHNVDLAEIWNLGSLLDELADMDAPSARRRIAHELAIRADPQDARPAAAMAAAQAICSGVDSARVRDVIGMDRRELVPIFRRTIGVGVKHFASLQRFRRSMLALRSAGAHSLATIAADHGYSDQAHLTREMQRFAGVPPTVLLGAATPTPNHLPADRIFKTPPRGQSRMAT